MRWKTTALLLVVTVLVGTYISLYELRQPSRGERARRTQQLLRIAPESVQTIALEMPNGRVNLTRTDAMWRIMPDNVRADGDRISQLLDAIDPLNAERLLTESSDHPLDPAAYGLKAPIGRMAITAHGAPTTILFGDAAALHNNRYLQIDGRPEIAVVSSDLFELANQPAETFRDPQLIRFSPWLIDEFAITAPASALTFERTNNIWRLVQPFADHADRAEVNGLLNTMTGMRIQRFIADALEPEQKSSYGLEAPQLTVRIVQNQPTTSTTVLAFGSPVPEASGDATSAEAPMKLVYATRSDEPGLYAVEAADVEALRRDPHGLRSKQCFEFLTPLITKIAVVREGAEWTIEHVEGRWTASAIAQPLETARVEAFLAQLLELRLGGFVEDHPTDLARYGLQTPYGTIALWSQDQPKPQRLLIGGVMEESTNRYGQIVDRDTIIRLPDEIMPVLSTMPEQLRPMAPEVTGTPSPAATSGSQ